MSFKTLGEALFARGFRRTVWVSFDDIRVREFGAFDPAAPLLDFPRRYGSAKRKGDLVGERFAAFLLEEVIHHPSNPLGLDNHQGYALRPGEEYDVRMVSAGGDTAVYDGLILPLHRTLFPGTPVPAPPPPAPPSPPKPPVPAPEPAPAPPAPQPPAGPPPTPVAQRVAELSVMAEEAAKSITAPQIMRAALAVGRSRFARLVLERAVELYRKVMA